MTPTLCILTRGTFINLSHLLSHSTALIAVKAIVAHGLKRFRRDVLGECGDKVSRGKEFEVALYRWPSVPIEIDFNSLALIGALILRNSGRLSGQHFHLYLIAYGISCQRRDLVPKGSGALWGKIYKSLVINM